MKNIKPSLACIAARYHSDKGLSGPDRKWNGNNYVDIYEAYFRSWTEKKIQLLEIGIGVAGPNWLASIAHGPNKRGGASLQMWRDYFPSGVIHGVDINPADHLNDDRITTHLADQGSRVELRKLRNQFSEGQFDVIIDDGSHRGDHQQITLEILWPCLKNGGLYIIEDLNDRGHGERSTGRHGSSSTVSTRRLFQELINGNTELLKPNAFENINWLDEVADLRFHSPRPLFDFRMLARELLRTILGRAKNGVCQTRFSEGSHKMLVIEKQ